MNVNEPVTLPAPKLEPLEPPSKWEREYAAFKRLLPELLKTHRGKYVAIHEERMVDSDTEQIPLILRVRDRIGNVAIHVDLVTDQPRPIRRIPHCRVYRPGGSGVR